jgi:hypothetical protein
MITYIITLILILLATINFNKYLIDNVYADKVKQRKWHQSQALQWAVIYLGVTIPYTIFSDWGIWLTLLTFACFYPHLYDIGLNIRRGEKITHKGEHDLSMDLKNNLFLIGIILIIIQTIWR